MSLFISFEGGEGTGKSTQAQILFDRLRETDYQPVFLHEPGTTHLGIHLRELLKGNPWGGDSISNGAELFLFAAARAELVSKFIKPELQQNSNVVIVADRYADSTIAYQGYGRKLPLEQVQAINDLATQGIMPQLTFLFDCPPEEGLKRVGSLQIELPLEEGSQVSGGRMDEEHARRFEEESMDFHKRVRKGYKYLAKNEPDRWRVISALKPKEEISEIVWRIVQSKLPKLGNCEESVLKLRVENSYNS